MWILLSCQESVRCRKSATMIWIAFAVVARVLCCEINCTSYTGRIEREKRREKETDDKRLVMWICVHQRMSNAKVGKCLPQSYWSGKPVCHPQFTQSVNICSIMYITYVLGCPSSVRQCVWGNANDVNEAVFILWIRFVYNFLQHECRTDCSVCDHNCACRCGEWDQPYLCSAWWLLSLCVCVCIRDRMHNGIGWETMVLFGDQCEICEWNENVDIRKDCSLSATSPWNWHRDANRLLILVDCSSYNYRTTPADIMTLLSDHRAKRCETTNEIPAVAHRMDFRLRHTDPCISFLVRE